MSKPMSEQMQKVAERYEKATGKQFGQKTNAQHIRSMSDEELGLFLGEWAERHLCWMQDGAGEVLCWLREPYEEDNNV